MLAAQAAAGAQLVIGTVTGITTAAGAVTAVKVQQQQQQGQPGRNSSEVELPADVVVLAMGPWTDAARAWLPTAPEMSGESDISVTMCEATCVMQSHCMWECSPA